MTDTERDTAKFLKLIRVRIIGESPCRFFVGWVHGHQERFGVRAAQTESLTRQRVEAEIRKALAEAMPAALSDSSTTKRQDGPTTEEPSA